MSKVYTLAARPSDGSAAVPGIASGEEIVAELRAGRMVIILDDADRENEAVLIMAAECVTAEAVAFMIRHTSGILCVPMDGEGLAQLELPQMGPNYDDAYRAGF